MIVRIVLQVLIVVLTLAGMAQAQAEKHRIGNGNDVFTPGKSIGLPPSRKYGQIGQIHGLRLNAIGTADVFGHGPNDLFIDVSGLFPFVGFDEAGVPRYGQRIELPGDPNIDGLITGKDGTIYGITAYDKQLHVSTFNREKLTFSRLGSSPALDLPRGMTESLGVWLDPRDRLHVYFAVPDGNALRNDPKPNAVTYMPYDGAGFWRGNLPRVAMYHATFDSVRIEKLERLARLSDGPGEFLFSVGGMAVLNLGADHPPILAAADQLSTFWCFPLDPETGVPGPKQFVKSPRGVALRHPVILPNLKAIPDPETGLSNLIVCDTCRSWHYKFSGKWTTDDGPIFLGPEPVAAEGGHLTLGSLCVISPGDMDRDGLIDLMVGNDAGHLLFVRNVGTPQAAAFDLPVMPPVGEKPLDIKAGYNGSVQGPQEAMWGYTCPTVHDWNRDGLPDVILNSITGNYQLLLQESSPDGLKFVESRLIYCDGLQLRLAWRSQPGITDWGLGGRLCMIAMDEQNLLRLFWRLDDENVERGELLKLQDGSPIAASVDKFAGQTGRSNIVPYDWDGDGAIDLMIGTTRGQQFLASKTVFYPSEFGPTRAATLLLLRNAGSNREPVFEYARLIEFQKERISLGIHICSPAFVDIGRGVKDLLIGEELGSVIYYPRESLTVSPPAK